MLAKHILSEVVSGTRRACHGHSSGSISINFVCLHFNEPCVYSFIGNLQFEKWKSSTGPVALFESYLRFFFSLSHSLSLASAPGPPSLSLPLFRSLTILSSLSLLHFQELSTRESEIELTNLTANTVYGVSVIARSKHGTSLPSTLLIINTTSEEGTNCRFDPASTAFTFHFLLACPSCAVVVPASQPASQSARPSTISVLFGLSVCLFGRAATRFIIR